MLRVHWHGYMWFPSARSNSLHSLLHAIFTTCCIKPCWYTPLSYWAKHSITFALGLQTVDLPAPLAERTGLALVNRGLTVYCQIAVNNDSWVGQAMAWEPLNLLPKYYSITLTVDLENGSIRMQASLASESHPWTVLEIPGLTQTLTLSAPLDSSGDSRPKEVLYLYSTLMPTLLHRYSNSSA